MENQHIWVTAYQGHNRAIYETLYPGTQQPFLFAFDARHAAYPISGTELEALRAHGVRVEFYSIPNPF